MNDHFVLLRRVKKASFCPLFVSSVCPLSSSNQTRPARKFRKSVVSMSNHVQHTCDLVANAPQSKQLRVDCFMKAFLVLSCPVTDNSCSSGHHSKNTACSANFSFPIHSWNISLKRAWAAHAFQFASQLLCLLFYNLLALYFLHSLPLMLCFRVLTIRAFRDYLSQQSLLGARPRCLNLQQHTCVCTLTSQAHKFLGTDLTVSGKETNRF